MSGTGADMLRVLIIDDQKAMRSIVSKLLRGIGIKDIDEAENGEEALDRLCNLHAKFPDVIVCDLHMDKVDGLQFCNNVRRDEKLRNNNVPILILTGDRNPLLHDVSRKLGAVSVMTKPITAEELKIQITGAVGFSFA